jgi:hypothetical protein
MAALDEARQQFPDLAALPDAALAAELHKQFYSDIPLEDFYQRIGFDWREAEAQENLAADPARPIPKGGEIAHRSVFLPVGRTAEGKNVLAVPGILHDPAAITGQVIEGNIGIGNVSGEDIANIAPAAGGPGVVNRLLSRGAKAKSEAVPVETVAETATKAAPELEVLAAKADAAAVEPAHVRLAGDLVDDAARARFEADRLANAGPDRAGNIRLDLIHAPEDVKAVIRQTAAENAEFLPARRGTITHAETRDMAGLLGMSADDLTKRKVGQAFNAEEMLAARELLVAQATKVRDLGRRAHGGSDADKAQFAAEVTRLVAIQEQVAGATAEAGRALSQFRMLAGATKEEIAHIVEASKSSGIDDMARKIAELDDPAKVAAFAANAYKAKTSDMLLEAWINALLSGPTTHAANMLSNALTTAWSIPESAAASAISKLTGSGISGREAFARAVGFLEGAKEGIPAAWRAYRTEQPTDLATKIEARTYRTIPSANIGGVEIGGKQVRIPGRLLMAEDEFFKAINYRAEVNALATRQAVNEGLSGRKLAERITELRASPTPEMQTAARTAAEKATFTNPLGDAGKGITQTAQAAPILRVVMPFIKTPINIVKFAAERSPFAPLFKEVRENLNGANGPVARDNQLARIALGSTVSAVTAYLAAEGHITGGGPGTNEGAKRALMRADGWQPYSVRIGDTYYSYSRFEPMGMLMGVAADMVELSNAMTKEEKANVAALMMGSVSNNLVSKTWLRGPSDALAAINDPVGYGPRYVQRLIGTVVPTGVAHLAQHSDPYLREARSVLDTIRSRLPGESEKLFHRRDAFGEPIKREGALGPDLLSPIYQSAAKNDSTIAEMLRLRVHPGRLQRTIRNTELTGAEFDTYSRVAGQTMKTALDTLVALPQWRHLPEAAQVDAMQDVIRKSRDQARTQVFAQFPDLALRVAAEALRRKRLPTE